MVRDPECAVVGTFSGAMSVAKMGLLICEMIDRGWLKVIITTGALIAHGFIETLGRAHYKYPEQAPDRQLFQQGYNRIYDTLEMEANLDYAEDVFRSVLEGLDSGGLWSSASLCRELGKYLAEHTVRFHYGVRLCPEPAHWGSERLHLQGGGLLGQVCLFRGWRPLRRGPLRRHHRLASPPQRRQPAS